MFENKKIGGMVGAPAGLTKKYIFLSQNLPRGAPSAAADGRSPYISTVSAADSARISNSYRQKCHFWYGAYFKIRTGDPPRKFRRPRVPFFLAPPSAYFKIKTADPPRESYHRRGRSFFDPPSMLFGKLAGRLNYYESVTNCYRFVIVRFTLVR